MCITYPQSTQLFGSSIGKELTITQLITNSPLKLIPVVYAPVSGLRKEKVMEQYAMGEIGGPATNAVPSALAEVRARRTAFVARFIVLRESKRTRAHRIIEMLSWEDSVSAEELAARFRQIFVENGDNMTPVDRDINRALAHSSRSLNYFIAEYSARSTTSFIDSLWDYERSNTLLFGSDEQPKPGGWRLPQELIKARDGIKPKKK